VKIEPCIDTSLNKKFVKKLCMKIFLLFSTLCHGLLLAVNSVPFLEGFLKCPPNPVLLAA
jgi:hypothetical protein